MILVRGAGPPYARLPDGLRWLPARWTREQRRRVLEWVLRLMPPEGPDQVVSVPLRGASAIAGTCRDALVLVEVPPEADRAAVAQVAAALGCRTVLAQGAPVGPHEVVWLEAAVKAPLVDALHRIATDTDHPLASAGLGHVDVDALSAACTDVADLIAVFEETVRHRLEHAPEGLSSDRWAASQDRALGMAIGRRLLALEATRRREAVALLVGVGVEDEDQAWSVLASVGLAVGDGTPRKLLPLASQAKREGVWSGVVAVPGVDPPVSLLQRSGFQLDATPTVEVRIGLSDALLSAWIERVGADDRLAGALRALAQPGLSPEDRHQRAGRVRVAARRQGVKDVEPLVRLLEATTFRELERAKVRLPPPGDTESADALWVFWGWRASALGRRADDRAEILERLQGIVEAAAASEAKIIRAQVLREAGEVDDALRLAGEAAEDRHGSPQARAEALDVVADILQSRGNLDEASRLRSQELLPAYESLGDVRSRAITLGKLADIHMARGELEEALRIRIDEELPIYEKLGDVRARAVTLGHLADIHMARGELDEALRIRTEEELPVYEKLGDVRSRAVTLGDVADIHMARGELDEALRIRTEEQLPVFDKLGDVRERAITLGKLADIHMARGELDQALRIRTEEELPVYERLGDIHSRAVTLGHLADIHMARGEIDEALRIRTEEELPVYESVGLTEGLVAGRANTAIALLRRNGNGDRARAVELLTWSLNTAKERGYGRHVSAIESWLETLGER